MSEKQTHDIHEDAPQTDPLAENQDELMPETPMPEITDGGRDPSRVPARPGHKTPTLRPNDEQLAAEKEVLKGIDRAEDDQRREARDITETSSE